MYQIEVNRRKHEWESDRWESDGLGDPNEFETYDEAAAMIPELARIFEDTEDNYRVIEISW